MPAAQLTMCRWKDRLNELVIQSSNGEARLVFFDRSPTDRDRPIEEFWVRITDRNLSAVGGVYAEYASGHPALLFADMARQWQGWPGELEWRSLEGEFELRCTHDRRGHIRIGIMLRSNVSNWEYGWEVGAAVMVEAGQLERLALDAAEFFGPPVESADPR